jgi:hypothetical protein
MAEPTTAIKTAQATVQGSLIAPIAVTVSTTVAADLLNDKGVRWQVIAGGFGAYLLLALLPAPWAMGLAWTSAIAAGLINGETILSKAGKANV